MPEVVLPAKCFISHAYADAAARGALIERLPADVTPFMFPPITVRPEEFVSDPLIDAVLDCDGMIYLRGGASDRSFWVALERDYALRAGKKVFAFDTPSGELTPDTRQSTGPCGFRAVSTPRCVSSAPHRRLPKSEEALRHVA